MYRTLLFPDTQRLVARLQNCVILIEFNYEVIYEWDALLYVQNCKRKANFPHRQGAVDGKTYK